MQERNTTVESARATSLDREKLDAHRHLIYQNITKNQSEPNNALWTELEEAKVASVLKLQLPVLQNTPGIVVMHFIQPRPQSVH